MATAGLAIVDPIHVELVQPVRIRNPCPYDLVSMWSSNDPTRVGQTIGRREKHLAPGDMLE